MGTCSIKHALTKVDKSSHFENPQKNYIQWLTLLSIYIYILFLNKNR